MFWYGITAVALAIILRFTGTRVIGIYTLESPRLISREVDKNYSLREKRRPQGPLKPLLLPIHNYYRRAIFIA